MKILFVAETYYPHINGVYSFIERLAVCLQGKGHEVAVVAPSATMHFADARINGIQVYAMPSFSVLFYRSIRLPVPLLLKKRIDHVLAVYKPDIIHLQGHFFLNKCVLQVNKKYKVPVIGTNHFMTENLTCFLSSPKLKIKAAAWLWKDFSTVFNQASIVTTPTETGAKLIRPRLSVPVLPVSNGIDLSRFSPYMDTRYIRKKYSIPDRPVLLSVGRLDPEKHIHEIIEATAIALKCTNFCLVVCGKGTEKEALERLVKKLGMEEQVIFTGFVSDEDLPCLYQISTCFVIASVAELQSIATMEAMASGLPVIAADAGALGELAHNGKNGYLFNTGDRDAIAVSISAIFNNSQLQKTMKKMSLEYIAAHDLNKTVAIYEDLYNKHRTKPVRLIKMSNAVPSGLFEDN